MPETETQDSSESTETAATSGGGQAEQTETSSETFTQDDLSRVGAKEHRRGKAEAAKALAEQLGMPVDEAKKILAAHQEREEAEATEADKARKEAETAKAELARAASELRATQLRAKIVEALTAGDGENAPVSPDYRDSAVDLALIHASRAEDTDDLDDLVAAAAQHVRDTASVFFVPGNGGPGTGTPKPPTKTGAQSTSTSTTPADEAKRMLEAHKPKKFELPAFGGNTTE